MKKIDKRACRAYADPRLTMDTDNGLLIANKVTYLVRTAVKIISRQRLLLLYVYSREQAAAGQFTPLWTIFQSRNDYINLAQKEDGSAVWRSAAFEQLDSTYNFIYKCAFYSRKDRERLEHYCKGEPMSGFRSLDCLQQKIKERRSRTSQRQKERVIRQRMTAVAALPRGLNGWIW